ncbi:MAG TPA: S9 family peptidase [Bacteroidales bacterium]|nr:S9 family peptidase [Bacteroidales bacterium]
MKQHLFPVFILFAVLAAACRQESLPAEDTAKQINDFLTAQEKDGRVMTPEILWKFRRLGSFVLSPDGSDVIYTVTDIDVETETRITNIYKVSVSGGDPVQLTTGGGSSPQWFNDGKSIAYVNKGTLYTMKPDGSDQKTVTGLSNFEIYSISPVENKLYFTRRVKIDQTANEKHDLPKAKVRIINDLMYRHWNYWSDYSYSHIFIASFNGSEVKDPKDIMEGQRYESPTSPYFDEREISWSPDGKYIAYTSKKLNGLADARSTNSDIYLYELKTSREVNITDSNKGYDKSPVFSPDGLKIAYQSMERDGYEADLDRLFLYDIREGKRTWLARGWDFDVENINWADDQNIYFTCAYLGTTQIFRTNLSQKGVDKVTEGIHDLGPLNLKSGVLISGIASMSMANEISVVDMKSGSVSQFTSINKHIYEFVKMGRVEERYIRTKDRKDLQMWVIYPPDFDPSKKYPAILYCKGGPQGPLGQSWSYRWNYQMMAAKGYIVIAPNRRGNSGFGQAWKEQISGDYGGANIQDYLDATDAMVKEPFVDKNRVGAVGASYGGYSVFYLAGMHGGRFKAFISHCGMFNFTSWYGSTEELWFPDKDIEGPYWNTPESYKFSPHLMVDNWDTPILIITGANDFRIPYTQSMEAFQAAQLKGIPSRLLYFEDEYHFVTKPQNAIVWQREFFEWIDTYLR